MACRIFYGDGLTQAYILAAAGNDGAWIQALTALIEDDVVEGDDVARFEAFDKIGSPGIALRCTATAVEHETVSRNRGVAIGVCLGGYNDSEFSTGNESLAVRKFGCDLVAIAGVVVLVGATPEARGVQRQAVSDAGRVIDALKRRGLVATLGRPCVVIDILHVWQPVVVIYKLASAIECQERLVLDHKRMRGRTHLGSAVGGRAACPIEVAVGAGKVQQSVLRFGLGHYGGAGCPGHLVGAAHGAYGDVGRSAVYRKIEHIERAGAFEPQLRLSGARADFGVEQRIHGIVHAKQAYMTLLGKSGQCKGRTQCQCKDSFHTGFRCFCGKVRLTCQFSIFF